MSLFNKKQKIAKVTDAIKVGGKMSCTVIDGKAVAADIRKEVSEEVLRLKESGITPCLAVILVGENPASVSYVTGKQKALAEVGMKDKSMHLPESTTQDELLSIISDLNNDPDVHGILVQLPLPKHIDEEKVIMAISPEKDVDGFHPMNVGNMMIGREAFLPCTPHGVLVLLERAGVKTNGARAVIIGRSNIVGKPLSIMLSSKKYNATVTMCHTGTKDIASYTKDADIVVAAAGHPGTVTADMVKEGAAVIDVGVNRIPDATKKSGFRLIGDVEYEAVKEKASVITPVPGGVGPMTIAMLMVNTLEAAKRKIAR